MNLLSNRTAIAFVILIGVVSLFGDMTYEGARSITGQYLAILGASGTIVGIVAGLGELIGYGVRIISGYLSDKTGKYWIITFVGYACNLLVVPLLSLAGSWPIAAVLIILERFGKGIRTPSRDLMLSYATKQTGRGWGFGIHEAMDQTGAVLGPVFVSFLLFFQGSYSKSFAMLLIPALCALTVLVFSRIIFPNPHKLEKEVHELGNEKFSKKYWFYVAAISCVAAGYVDFALIAFHFKKTEVISDIWIPVLFAVSMGIAGISALIFGHFFDKFGIEVLIFATVLASFFAPFVFIDNFYFALIGMILWGIGLGTQESIMRALVANIIHRKRRGTAYGIINLWFGLFWFIGSALMGFLYDISIMALVMFSLGIQWISIPILFIVKNLK